MAESQSADVDGKSVAERLADEHNADKTYHCKHSDNDVSHALVWRSGSETLSKRDVPDGWEIQKVSPDMKLGKVVVWIRRERTW